MGSFLLPATARHQGIRVVAGPMTPLPRNTSKAQRKKDREKPPKRCTVTLDPCKSPPGCISCSPNLRRLGGDPLKIAGFCATSPVAAFPSFYFMLSCGSFSFGKRQCLAFRRVRGKGSLFSNSPAPGFAAASAAARPLAGRLPAKQPGSPAPKAGWKWGFRAQPGRTRVEEGRKVQHPTGGVPCPSTEEEPTISPSLQL